MGDDLCISQVLKGDKSDIGQSKNCLRLKWEELVTRSQEGIIIGGIIGGIIAGIYNREL
jgi:hypothetical protein